MNFPLLWLQSVTNGSFVSKIPVIKFIDSTIGRLVLTVLPGVVPGNAGHSPMGRLLLIRPGGIGDAVLLAPAVRQFKRSYPDCHITVLAEKRNSGVFALIPTVDRLICYDRPGEFLEALRGRYDVVIDTEQWHRLSAIVARLVKAPVKIGYGTNERRRMFTHTQPYSHDEYEADSFLQLLRPLGIDAGDECNALPWLTVPGEAVSLANKLLEPLGDGPLVAMFPGASIPERRWGADRFRATAVMLASLGVKTVVVGGQVDREQGDVIVEGTAGLNLAGRISLAGTAAVLKRSCLLLSGDSGVLHIAAGLDVPTVSLFGPGRALKWAPRGEKNLVIYKGLACSPCTTYGTTPPCPVDNRCMKEITVDEVFNGVTVLLTSTGSIRSRCCKRDWIETSG